MTWDNAHTLHIFVPPSEPFMQNWVEQILGEVVRPIIADYDEAISWLWITRYSDIYTEDNLPVGVSIPEEFRANGWYRFVALRFHANSDSREVVQTRTIELAQGAGCFTDPRGWIQYNPIEDVGGDRFIRNNAEVHDRTERARLILRFVDTTIRLMLHSLIKDESDRWVNEPNMILEQNPKGSMFESIRHLFFNATGVPTTVLVAGDWTSLQLGTRWMSALTIAGGQANQYLEIPITY